MAEREPTSGDVLGGRYEILSELGRGGMATVYRGMDRRLQRRVAVKVFRGGFSDAVDPARTTQEMRLLAAVNHPSVVSVLDASNGDGVFGAYLVMELVVGDDLGALLHRARGPLSADFARRIVADVASALAALHAQGVVHRDVKPANILVPSSAQSSPTAVAAKLTDFGIAQLVDGARLTAPESILGTAAYLSPEQVRGAAPRPESDVYSLGLVLLEALTGKRAFPGPAAEAAMARLQRPPALPADASPALAELLSRMTALEPSHRPTADVVGLALREQLVGRVTAPDAATTAPTPMAGIAAAAVAAAAASPHDTAPQVPLLTPSRGMPLTGATATATAARTTPSRRFPTVLAVAASALAAAVAGVAISAAANLGAQDPAAARDAPPAASAPAATTAQQQEEQAAAPAAATAVTPKARPTASPTRTPTASPTPTTAAPTTSAPPTPAATEPGDEGVAPEQEEPTSAPPAPAETSAPPQTIAPPAQEVPSTPADGGGAAADDAQQAVSGVLDATGL